MGILNNGSYVSIDSCRYSGITLRVIRNNRERYHDIGKGGKVYIMRALYLNNSGTRWIIPGNTVRVVGTVNGKAYHKVRKVDYYESLGNFATTTVRVNGVRYTGFADDHFPDWEPITDDIPVLDLDKCRKG